MNQSNILDQAVPDIGVSTLKPSPFRNFPPTLKKIALNAAGKVQKRINDFADWLMAYVPPTIKASASAAFQKILNLFPKQVIKVQLLKTALKNYTKSYDVDIVDLNPLKQLTETQKVVQDKLRLDLVKMKGLKATITLKITFEKQTEDKAVTKTAFFNSRAIVILNKDDVSETLQNASNQIINKIGNWLSEGSGWSIFSVDGHFVNLVQYTPLHGSTYIALPEELRNAKKGLINIKNKDNECFRWCHLAKVYSEKVKSNRERISHYKKYVDTLNYDGIKFPVSIKQIPKIEEQNNISINVIGYENKQRFPLFVSKKVFETTLDLLLIMEDEKQHYVWIKDFNRFMYNQSKHQHRKHFCRYCLQCFSSEEILHKHTPNCIIINGKQAIEMPKKGSSVKFNNFHKQLPVPFVIYADFEAITQKIDSCQPNDEKSYTERYQKHIDCGYSYKLVCCYDDKFSRPIQLYRGKNAVYKFLEAMLEEVDYCEKTKNEHFNQPMDLTNKDEENFQAATKCHICKKGFSEEDKRVRDHCHVTGKYRGAAHNECNRNFRLTHKIPVIFHNLRGYDSHFIMQEIGKFEKDIKVIPNNLEKYMAFFLGKYLKFIDSFQFMSSSLETLVKNVPLSDLKYTSQEFQDEKLELMKRKGVYPYDYMNSFDKFDDRNLPSKKEFYSLLTDEDINDEDYKHAQNVWTTFKLESMGQYHDLYLKSDVLLLADVFEKFRKTCLQYYELDPCHYFTSPGLSWDAMLKMTEIKLELMTDIEKFLFIEKGVRGGVSYISKRYAKANNKYMNNYDSKQPSNYITYLDANNLYGWAMSQNLPTGGFKWLSEKEIDLANLPKGKGLILEVDLDYPEHLHDSHNDYPLAPEKMEIKHHLLSDYCKQLQTQFNIKVEGVKKLIPNLKPKKSYVLYYKNLKQYIELGLKVTKVHRVLEFNESPWLKKYIDFNTEKRKTAKSDFEKDFFKLMNNSVFGKTIENLRKRVNVTLINEPEKLLKHCAKPTYVSSKIFNKNLVAVHKIKESLTLNRPAYVGMCILDISKTLMYDFHYNYIREKYGKNAKLLFTDTDSVTYDIKTEDVYKDFWADKDKFDFSGYKETSDFYDLKNKKVIGKMKDETAGVPIVEFVGLRSKMYSYVTKDEKGCKTAKGIKKNVVRNLLKHEDYKNTLFNNRQMFHKMKSIRSENHKIYSVEINKKSLSCFDDKRYILSNGIDSFAYGHY